MKRSIILATAILLLGACSTKEIDFQTPVQDDVVFYASFEQPAKEGTRVYANEDLLLRWTADDRVSIFNKTTYNQEYKFLGETGDNAGGFNKVDNAEFVTDNDISHVVSVYPYQALTKITESEVLTVTLPTEQSYAQNTFGLGANTMVSVSSDNVLQYKTVGGYLVFKLYGEGVSVSSITLKGNNGEKLAGNASVTMPLDGVPSVELASDAATEITLNCVAPVQLGATAEESTQFWFVVPPVLFSKGFTITVTSTGGVYEQSTSKSISIERNKLTKMSPMAVDASIIPSTLEAVDLGLSVKWGSFNLGASKPEEYGDYYAWSETEPYYCDHWPEESVGPFWLSYKWCMGTESTLTKYCTNSKYGYNGFTDAKTVLDPEDDAAHANLGGSWRMPTDAEWKEMLSNCSSTYTTQNGVYGRIVTASNGNSIFLPAAGGRSDIYLTDVGRAGYYWSSSLDPSLPYLALNMYFGSGSVSIGAVNRYHGFSVRPVYAASTTIPVESISLDKTEEELVVGKTAALVATVLPENATNKTVTWSSSNTSVATVSSNGIVTGVGAGTATITVTTSDGGKTATCTVTVTEPSTVATPEAIDLGLSVKWASFNLGATKPEEYGDHYAWGETGPKEDYAWSTYKWCMGPVDTLTKYCADSFYGYNGFTDGKTVLDPEDDAAHVNLGGKWRMPTDDEWTELRENCTWSWTTQNGGNGYLVTGPNGNSIFLPAAGLRVNTNLSYAGSNGFYWSSSLCTGYSNLARSVNFGSGYVDRLSTRYYGHSVRPVTE